jgi:hypothetical protein
MESVENNKTLFKKIQKHTIRKGKNKINVRYKRMNKMLKKLKRIKLILKNEQRGMQRIRQRNVRKNSTKE